MLIKPKKLSNKKSMKKDDCFTTSFIHVSYFRSFGNVIVSAAVGRKA